MRLIVCLYIIDVSLRRLQLALGLKFCWVASITLLQLVEKALYDGHPDPSPGGPVPWAPMVNDSDEDDGDFGYISSGSSPKC